MKDAIVNFGVDCTQPVDLQSADVLRFAEDVSRLVPELDQVERSEKGGKFRLFQRGARGYVREVRVTADGVQAAAGSELAYEERLAFAARVAEALETLRISMFNVRVVDLRHIFRITHWGNHHDLVAQALWGRGLLQGLVQGQTTLLTSVDFAFNCELVEGNVVFAFAVNPQTSAREIRAQKYDGDDVSVICGLARVGGFVKLKTYADMLAELGELWTRQLKDKVVASIIEPLRRAAVGREPQDER